MLLPAMLTATHVAWMTYWGTTYKRIRQARSYAAGRTLVDTNKRYKFIGYLTFFTHNFIALAAYWSSAAWLFKFHENATLKLVGVAILGGGTALHVAAIKHLGANYSPCFDSHLPKSLVTTGPYSVIRHPDYLAKLIVAFGLFLMTASGWALALLLWLAAEVSRSVFLEEKALRESLPGYADYQRRTARLIPFIF